MTPRRAKMYVWLFLLLCGAVGANVLLLQPRGAQTSGTVAGITVDPGAGRNIPRQPPGAPAADARSGEAETLRAVQRELKRLGFYSGSLDGRDGPVLRAAVWDFEASRGAPVTALPGEAILKDALFAGEADAVRSGPVRIGGPAAEHLLRTVQQNLAAQGLTLMRPDGRFTDETQRAIREFESRRGLAPTGRITAAFVERLLAPDAQAQSKPSRMR